MSTARHRFFDFAGGDPPIVTAGYTPTTRTTTSAGGRVYPHAEPSADVRRWLTVQAAEGKRHRTVLERRQTLARLERDLEVPAVAASAGQIADWLGRDPQRRSATTIISDHSKLRAFYRWAQQTGLRPDDPTANIRAPRRPRRAPRPITAAQFWRLDAQAAGDPGLRAMIRLAGLAGLRVHEVGRFHGRDLDWEQQTITVQGKGGHRDTIPAHAAILEIARRMPRLGYWFPSQRRDHIGGRTVSERMRLHMIRCKVPGTPHALRHFLATELVARGADLRVTQEIMRHSMLSTTAIYVAVADGRKRAAIDMLCPTPRP